jgi:hypothetical protein
MAALLLVGCGGSAQTVVTVTATPSDPVAVDSPSAEPEPSESASDPVVEPSEEPTEEESSFKEALFGEALTLSSGDSVTLGKPVLADCQYSYSGCADPEVGDRVVSVPITIKNDSGETVEWGSDYFILEFADGTQMEAGDGSAIEYEPDNAMDYDVKIRPGATYKSVLVFEAPKGAFVVLMLDSSYDGEPIAAWS